MSGKQGLYNRHEEIRLALRFFLQSFYKSKQQGTVAEPTQVLYDFARYKGFSPIIDRLSTRPRQQWADSLQQPPPRGRGHHAGTAAAAAALPLAPLTSHTAAAQPPAAAHTYHGTTAAASTTAQHGPIDREELGRSSWVLLHTLAAQLPERPSRRQQRELRTFMDSFARVYPCGDCAAHFQQLLRTDPPDVSSGPAFQQWMCRAHNRVNRALGKPAFNCELVGARWAPLDCDAANSCDMGVARRATGR